MHRFHCSNLARGPFIPNRLHSSHILMRPAPVGVAVSRRHHRLSVVAAATDPYQVLGIPRTATAKEIKSAFRKKALKLHPDVNKAPDARERFMECKNAYQMLMDHQEQQKKGQRGTGGSSSWDSRRSSSSSGWGGGSAGYTGSGFGFKSQQQPEDFYGLGDFFRDLEKEFATYSKERAAKGEGPKSLWEELQDIGEEFVEFLEKNVLSDSDSDAQRTAGTYETYKKQEPPRSSYNSSNAAGSSSGYSGTKMSDAFRRPNTSNTSSTGTTSNTGSRGPPPPPSSAAPKSRKEIIDDELAALKKKMGLDK